jgi:uncharacterized phage protein (TIGR02218 family)
MTPALRDHLATGCTTTCRAWAIARADGVTLGFTDHDGPLAFEGIAFRPDPGLTARALVQGTGLAVDNSEAEGALTSDAITEADIEAGRYDGAEVRQWLVNWADPSQRALRFRGTIGEIRRAGGTFHAELRGLTEALNRPLGRLYQRSCSASLGDRACRFDLASPGYAVERPAPATDGQSFRLADLPAFAPRWFERGRLLVLTGAAQGLSGLIRHDRSDDGGARLIELWSPLRAPVAEGDLIRLEPGCDRRAETCGTKFANILNFQGFPFIPGEDWLLSTPLREGDHDGGRLG